MISLKTYWHKRSDLRYYEYAADLASRHCKPGGHLLDVGGGVMLGCKYLSLFRGFKSKTSVETWDEGYRMPGVKLIQQDFQTWQTRRRFTLVLCLQVLEHIRKVELFARKLFKLGQRVIISVPYMWPAGLESTHVHDPVNLTKLISWTKRPPIESQVVSRRLVAIF